MKFNRNGLSMAKLKPAENQRLAREERQHGHGAGQERTYLRRLPLLPLLSQSCWSGVCVWSG